MLTVGGKQGRQIFWMNVFGGPVLLKGFGPNQRVSHNRFENNR
ncbi:hypothetical protein BSU04_22745 [Caballeronia sordidicola]|uniref:Uncharacterized protein n=1 Tax=Caballeronia sordidicola TaxID=196367 RepID=A0A226WZT4_CABSO|nr:hypothetical protein BSU04_22745 [Caballeronia sordidicola]